MGFAEWNIILIMIWDFAMNILCVLAFVYPLHKVLRSVRGSTTMSYEMTLKMKHVGIKVGILTFVSCITTIIGLILYTSMTFGHVFPYDWAVNSVCLMLMTPYYPDRKYYNRLCGLCIKCCFAKYKNVALALKEQHMNGSQNKTAGTNESQTNITASPDTEQSANLTVDDTAGDLTKVSSLTPDEDERGQERDELV